MTVTLELTLHVLNCFKDYKRCIHISYHILDFIQQKKIDQIHNGETQCAAYPILSMPCLLTCWRL